MDDDSYLEHRAYSRCRLGSVDLEVTIHSYKGNELHLPSAAAFLHDISGGGLFFSTDLDFPFDSQAILRFDSPVIAPVVPHGVVVRKVELTPSEKTGKFGYGIRFTEMSSLQRSQLLQKLEGYPKE